MRDVKWLYYQVTLHLANFILPCCPMARTLGRTAIGLRDLLVVKLFLVGEGDERLGEKRERTRGDAAGEEGAEDAGMDNQS